MGRKKFTRFERARILGARALQISMGAPLLMPSTLNPIDPLDIAIQEFENNLIPITSRRASNDNN